jgi:hypothetical protein
MLTPEEFSALMSILQRAPMTPGEVLAMQVVIAKLKPAEPGKP